MKWKVVRWIICISKIWVDFKLGQREAENIVPAVSLIDLKKIVFSAKDKDKFMVNDVLTIIVKNINTFKDYLY